jgi:hypothetical protein
MGTNELIRLPSAARVEPSARACNHLYDTTTQYDHDRKLLTFLLVCPVCRVEKVVETMDYEPSFTPSPVPENDTAGGTVHQLPTRHEPPLRRAA